MAAAVNVCNTAASLHSFQELVMNKVFFAVGLCLLLSTPSPTYAQQGYEASNTNNAYVEEPPHRFGYWQGVQLLIPFNLPPEREEIALSLWVQLMDVCPECRTAYSGHHRADSYNGAYAGPRDGRHYRDGPGQYDDRYPPSGGAPARAGQGYGQGYDAVIRGQNRSVTIPANEYKELLRKAQAFDQSQRPQ